MAAYLVAEAERLLRTHRFDTAEAQGQASRMVEIITRMQSEERIDVGDVWLISLHILIERHATVVSDSDAA